MTLAEKLRAARQFTLDLDGITYTLRRPTDAEAALIGDMTALDMVRRFVIGWNHTEISLGIPGGTSTHAAFSADLWSEWVDDQPALWGPMAKAIIDAYKAHSDKRSDSVKN